MPHEEDDEDDDDDDNGRNRRESREQKWKTITTQIQTLNSVPQQ